MLSKDKPGRGWFSRVEMAAFLDVTPQQFDRGYRRYASKEATKEIGAKLYFHARSLLNAWNESQKPSVAPDSIDPLLAGDADSPALEEYRKARARLAWMEVEMREKTHLPLAELEPALMHQCSVLRQAGDNLARQYGNDAAAVLNQAVDQWEASLEKLLKNDTDAAIDAAAGDGDPHPAAADDARVR